MFKAIQSLELRLTTCNTTTMDGPDQIGPDFRPKRTLADQARRIKKTFTTR